MKPFKVVCIKEIRYKRRSGLPGTPSKSFIKKGKIYTVTSTETHDGELYYTISECKEDWGFNSGCFAPIQTNYADATAEVLEKFKSPEETPDKILKPEKIKLCKP